VYTSAVVIIPPKVHWGSIQTIRKIYDRQFYRWMPHITLLYPFRPKNQFYEFGQKFSDTCDQIKPFEITLNRIEYFFHGHQNYTMWLNPEPKELLIEPQTNLVKIVPACNDVNNYKNGYTPHLSIGQIKGKNKLHKTISELESKWKQLSFVLKEIYFISRENFKTSKFQIEKQFLLNF